MSTEMKSVSTARMGEVSMTQFAGGKDDGVCVQFTARTRSMNGQDMFQQMQFNKADAVAMATAMMEWAPGQRDEA